jgi:pilus assembly protein Flp/PilA
VTHIKDDSGASAVEYGLIVAAIAAIVVTVVVSLGAVVGDTFSDSCTKLNQMDTSQDCNP